MTGMQTVNKEKLSWITFAAGPEARSFAPVEMDVHQVYYGRHTSYIGVAQGGSATSVCLASIVRLYRTAVRRASSSTLLVYDAPLYVHRHSSNSTALPSLPYRHDQHRDGVRHIMSTHLVVA
jgi:hypothetical protein